MKYVDANIVIHNLLGDERMGRACEEYLKRISRGEVEACTSVHTITEVYAFLKAALRSEQKIGSVLRDVFSYGIKLLPLKPEIIIMIPVYMGKGWKYGDAIHYLTMKEERIEEIVSDDRFFDGLDVKRIDLTRATNI